MQRMRNRLNRKQLCKCCNQKIINKYRNALYCKECEELRNNIKKKIYGIINMARSKHEDYNIQHKSELITIIKEVK